MPPKKDKNTRQASAEDDSNDGEAGGELVPNQGNTGPSSPFIPGISAEAVHGLMTLFSGMLRTEMVNWTEAGEDHRCTHQGCTHYH